MLSSRGVPQNSCSLNLQKAVRNPWQQQNARKKLWMNSVLIKIQFFIMLLYFRRENEINNFSLYVSFELFVKKLHHSWFDWVLNTTVSWWDYCLRGLSSLYVYVIVPECFKNVVSRSQWNSRLWFWWVFVFQIQICFFFLDTSIFMKWLYVATRCFSQALTFQKNMRYLLDRKLFKNDEKCFLFHLNSSFRSQNI